MKRLTWQNYDMCQFCGEGACCEHYCDNTFPVCDDKAIYDRLSAIEDILGDEYELERLQELVKEDREGRCVVLPCKVGDTVYYIATTKHGFRYVKFRPFGVDDFTWFNAHFGKTVFLTRAEAEAVLKTREQDE